MQIDQSEIDRLLAGATAEAVPQSPSRIAAPERRAPAKAAPGMSRVLKLRVPVIVRIASQKLPVDALRRLSIGTILQFEKSIEAPLELLINNRLLGTGEAVKVGEQFGFRVSGIATARERVLSLRG